MLLGKKKPDKFEVYNDYNHNLVNLFRCMRDRPLAFIKELGFYPLNSRDDFNAIRDFFKQEKFDDKYLDEELQLTKIILSELKAEEVINLYVKMKKDYDLRRAVMFLKLLRYSYSSGGKSFACQPFSVVSLFKLIEQVGKRFENVVIENQDFEVLIKHYDRENAFFYCDPPYFSSEYVYQCGFTWNDHIRLKKTHLQMQRANGLCHTMIVRKFAIYMMVTLSLISSESTVWFRSMRQAENSLNY